MQKHETVAQENLLLCGLESLVTLYNADSIMKWTLQINKSCPTQYGAIGKNRLYIYSWDQIDSSAIKIVNKVSQRSLRTNERSIRYGEDLYVSDVTAIYLSL